MMDELDALKAALKNVPKPADSAREAALRLAMENFDRLQGSGQLARPIPESPKQVGPWTGVIAMLNKLKSKPALAASTSVAALCLGFVVVLPLIQNQPNPATAPTVQATRSKDAASSAPVSAEATASGAAAKTVAPAAPVDLAPLPATPEEIAVDEGAVMAEAADPVAVEMAELESTADIAPLEKGIMPVEAPMPSAMRAQQNAGEAMTSLEPLPMPDSEAYANAPANAVKVTASEPVSTFSIDVDTASYAVVRATLNAGVLPTPEQVRVEEMVNYFPYAYPAPTEGEAFRPSITVMQTPWNPETRLVHIGIQGALPEVADRPALNLVFLVDTSGSMDEPNKLPLLKQSLGLMLANLRPQDQVAIVAYAGSAGEVLPPTAASDRATIMAALEGLAAGGGTDGAQGLELAYQVAANMAATGEVSRVLLATDGDFNLGIDDPEALKAYIAEKRDSGTYLSVLGFGRGNLDDATMQALAQNGNGTASYIDTLTEARKVLVDQLTGALFPIADNVKIQVEWNPAAVAEYRLIGYETRALNREDFNNDAVDAGDIGAGTSVTAIYEVTAPNSPALRNTPLRYGDEAAPAADPTAELGFLRLRHVAVGETSSSLQETPILPAETEASEDVRFAVAIAGYGQTLAQSTYLGDWGWDQMIDMAVAARGEDAFGLRAEAITLMRLSQALAQ